MLWRLHAQRLLVERGKQDVVPQLIALARRSRGRRDRHQRRRVPRAVDAARPRRHRQHRPATRAGPRSSAEAPGRRRPQGGGDGAAVDARGGRDDHRRDSRCPDPRRHGSRTPGWRRCCASPTPPSEAAGKATSTPRRSTHRISAIAGRAAPSTSPPAATRTSFLDAVPRRSGQAAPWTRCRSRCASAAPGPTGGGPRGRARCGLEADGGARAAGRSRRPRPASTTWCRFARGDRLAAGRTGPAAIHFGRPSAAFGEVCGQRHQRRRRHRRIPRRRRAAHSVRGPQTACSGRPQHDHRSGIQNLRRDGSFLGAPARPWSRRAASRRPLPLARRRGLPPRQADGRQRAGPLQPARLSGRPRGLGRTPPPADAVWPRRRPPPGRSVVLRLERAEGSAEVGSAAMTVAAGQLVDLVVTNTDVIAAQLRPRRARLARGHRRAAADALVSSPTGQVPAVRARPAAGARLQPAARTGPVDRQSSSARRARPGPTLTSARSRATGG